MVRTTTVEPFNELERGLILDGTQGGLGWGLAITRATGKALLTASGGQVAVVVFGASTNP